MAHATQPREAAAKAPAKKSQAPVLAQPPEHWRPEYAAGLIPLCIGKEDGKGYLLLALQGRSWSAFWGWQDYEDQSIFHTAAREGWEEGLGVFGTPEELVRVMSACGELPDDKEIDKKEKKTEKAIELPAAAPKPRRTYQTHARELFNNCFCIHMGVLDAKQRDHFTFKFGFLRWDPDMSAQLTKFQRETARVRWIRADRLYSESQAMIAAGRFDCENDYVYVPEFDTVVRDGQTTRTKLRRFVAAHFLDKFQHMYKRSGGWFTRFCLEGKLDLQSIVVA